MAVILCSLTLNESEKTVKSTRHSTHRGDSPLFHTTARDPNEDIRDLCTAAFGLAISTTTPQPDQTALATEMVAICSAWGALDAQGPLAASNTLAYSPQ